jgi:hypothetical protein
LFILQANAACPCFMFMFPVHASRLHVHAACYAACHAECHFGGNLCRGTWKMRDLLQTRLASLVKILRKFGSESESRFSRKSFSVNPT